MHPSEREFANLLDYYEIKYLYEPRSFPLRWDGNRVVEMHTPDFYLPEYDQYFELTTMKQNLVTQKNRKLRHVREMYPEVNIQLLYRRDLMRLMGKYGFGPLGDASVEGTERVLFSEEGGPSARPRAPASRSPPTTTDGSPSSSACCAASLCSWPT